MEVDTPIIIGIYFLMIHLFARVYGSDSDDNAKYAAD